MLNSNLKGKKILIQEIDDPHADDYKGRVGVVTEVDDMGQLHGTWGGLALIPGADKYTILEDK